MTREVVPGEREGPDATIARRVGRTRSSRAPAGSTPRGSPAPDVVIEPASEAGSEGAVARSGSGSGITGAAMAEVMLAEEATRAHGFSAVIALVCAGVIPCLPLLGGDPGAKLLCGAGLVAAGLSSLWVWVLTRAHAGGARYGKWVHRGYGWTLVLCAALVEYYFGVFSPVPVVLTLGVYYLGQSSDRSHSFLLPLVVIATYAALSLLTATATIDDRGLFAAHGIGVATRIFAAITVSCVLGITWHMARVSRRALREAIERSNDALLIAQRREAQLAEAHHQLDRAMRVAVGKPGRYTGAQAGQYRLGLIIGVGAIGEVYAAEHVQSGERAAVKLLQATALSRDDLVERILREGTINSRLEHPHVVRVLEVGRMDDGAPYLAMELLTGRDLAARLRQEGQLGLPELTRLAEEMGAGLQHAHDLGVVHRDLKPLNIYEAEQDGVARWKILDFGISKLAASSGTLTQEGIVGTPGYMSPEQARGAAVDHRSDVFSMALVLYRAMTGQPAFPGDSTPQIMFDIVYKMPKRPSSVTKDLPSDVDLVMAIALAKDPGDRFQSAADLAHALSQACERKLGRTLRERGAAATHAYPWGSSLTTRHHDGDERAGG